MPVRHQPDPRCANPSSSSARSSTAKPSRTGWTRSRVERRDPTGRRHRCSKHQGRVPGRLSPRSAARFEAAARAPRHCGAHLPDRSADPPHSRLRAGPRISRRGRQGSRSGAMAVVAVGGYGRGEMLPHSDIDLLFLMPTSATPKLEKVVEYMLYMLWDLGLKVGHSTRSVAECLKPGRADMTIRTALLEARWIWGDQALFQELMAPLSRRHRARHPEQFVEAKLAERNERHSKLGEAALCARAQHQGRQGRAARPAHALLDRQILYRRRRGRRAGGARPAVGRRGASASPRRSSSCGRCAAICIILTGRAGRPADLRASSPRSRAPHGLHRPWRRAAASSAS